MAVFFGKTRYLLPPMSPTAADCTPAWIRKELWNGGRLAAVSDEVEASSADDLCLCYAGRLLAEGVPVGVAPPCGGPAVPRGCKVLVAVSARRLLDAARPFAAGHAYWN